MKVRASVKPICDKCRVIKRDGKVMVICSKSAKPNKFKAKIKNWRIIKWQELLV